MMKLKKFFRSLEKLYNKRIFIRQVKRIKVSILILINTCLFKISRKVKLEEKIQK